MALYGTTTEHFGQVAVAMRFHASRNPRALRRQPITLEDHAASPYLADPIRRLDCCQESDGACAYIVTTAERARDLKARPVRVLSAAMGAEPRWPSDPANQNMRTADFATGGQAGLARRVFGEAGVTPNDVDVALLFDNFTPQVVMSLEDLGFCGPGEGGPFVLERGITWPDGQLPVNTHGGLHSEAYVHQNHVLEAVRQLRGTSTSQVADAEVAIVAGTPGRSPTSLALLGR
jgi:acetyl-CoA acetyltransferase